MSSPPPPHSSLDSLTKSTKWFVGYLLALLVALEILRRNPASLEGIASWLVLGGDDASDIYYAKGESPPPPPPSKTKILYMLTSSSDKTRDGNGDRIESILIPVLLDGVESLLRPRPLPERNYQVDVYLILKYNLTESKERRIRSALPKSVGLQIWQDATPMDYDECDRNLDSARIVGNVEKWNSTKCIGGLTMAESGIIEVDIGLARQHRYIIKDKFRHYDVFISLEDDMRVMRSHVDTHLRVMNHVRKLNVTESPIKQSQLDRIHPGFVRVEALQSLEARKRVFHAHSKEDRVVRSIKFHKPEKTKVDPSICCESKRLGMNGNETGAIIPIESHDLITWESGIQGFGILDLGGRWYVAMPGTYHEPLPNYWTGNVAAPKYKRRNQPLVESDHRPQLNDPAFLGQPAFWIMTKSEIYQRHTETCHGGFVPPFDRMHFPRDGVGMSVEFWSGGLQMWYSNCNMMRLMELARFSHHFIYHSANNKQIDIQDKQRLVRMDELYAQLRTVLKQAKKAKKKAAKSKLGEHSYLRELGDDGEDDDDQGEENEDEENGEGGEQNGDEEQ